MTSSIWFLKWYKQVEVIATEMGFVAYNHIDEIAYQLNDQVLSVNILDGHPSAKLNEIYGKKLFTVIVEHFGIQ